MCEFTETDSGQLSMLDDPSDSEITDNFPEDTGELSGDMSVPNDDQLPGQIDMFEEDVADGNIDETKESEEEIPEDTQSDLEKVNHPDMTLEEVQELQGVKENEDGKLETTGEGTGNDEFKDSLPEDYKTIDDGQPSDEYRQTVDDNYAEMEKQIDDSSKEEGWDESMRVHDDDWSKERENNEDSDEDNLENNRDQK